MIKNLKESYSTENIMAILLCFETDKEKLSIMLPTHLREALNSGPSNYTRALLLLCYYETNTVKSNTFGGEVVLIKNNDQKSNK